jgi:hypothetical protein
LDQPFPSAPGPYTVLGRVDSGTFWHAGFLRVSAKKTKGLGPSAHTGPFIRPAGFIGTGDHRGGAQLLVSSEQGSGRELEPDVEGVYRKHEIVFW